MNSKKAITKKQAIARFAIVLGILILPLIYSITYLKGFWDPYNNLGNIRVAIVNQDICSEECKSTELVKKLQDSDSFNFQVTDKNEAENGLKNKKYYASLTIPSDFSESFDKVATNERHSPVLTFRPNDKTNYIASQLIGTAMTKVESNLSQNVSGEIINKLTEDLQSVPEQTQEIADGLAEMENATARLASGANQLYSGNNRLSNGITSMKWQIDAKSAAISRDVSPALNQKQIDAIASRINEVYSENFIAQIEQLAAAKAQSQIATQKALIEASAEQGVMQEAEQIRNAAGLAFDQMAAALGASVPPQQLGAIKKIYQDQVLENAKTIAKKSAVKTAENTAKVVAKDVSGKTALQTADQTARKLAPQVADQVKASAKQQTLDALNSLSMGLGQLSAGNQQIGNGLNELTSGSRQLNDGVRSAKDRVDDKISSTKEETKKLDGISDYAKTPAKVELDAYGKVDNYGTFFSPFFMSLSLWLGGLLIAMGLYYDPDNRFEVLGRDSKRPLVRVGIYTIIGIAQSLILGVVLRMALKFDVTNLALYYGSCVFIGLCFLSVILFLFFHFGDIGKFIAIVWLVIQLAACAGTFPIETEPNFFQNISPFMPMTYSVGLLRESFVKIDPQLLWKDVIALAGILIIANCLTITMDLAKSRRNKKRVA